MPVHTIALLVVVGLLCLASIRTIAILYKYRGSRVITCPENQAHAGVSLDVRRVVATGLVSAPKLRLSSCSRWPERAGCGQECLSQIEAGPTDCLVRTILSEWYAKQKCVFCGLDFGDVQWAVRKPAVLTGKQVLLSCGEIPAENLPEVLAAAKPVCFSCYTATTWVKQHPELTVDRSSKPADK